MTKRLRVVKSSKSSRKRRANGQQQPEPEPNPAVPLAAVPHLFNAKMLEWQQAQFNGLKAIHDQLERTVALLKDIDLSLKRLSATEE